MLDYDSSTDLWKILWDGNQNQEWIPRIYLLFLTEDPLNHAQRVKAAVQGRADTEAQMVKHLPKNLTFKVLRTLRGKHA
jgi:hypothetical protein